MWAVEDSNLWHQQRQCCALPTELTARINSALSAKTANRPYKLSAICQNT